MRDGIMFTMYLSPTMYMNATVRAPVPKLSGMPPLRTASSDPNMATDSQPIGIPFKDPWKVNRKGFCV